MLAVSSIAVVKLARCRVQLCDVQSMCYAWRFVAMDDECLDANAAVCVLYDAQVVAVWMSGASAVHCLLQLVYAMFVYFMSCTV